MYKLRHLFQFDFKLLKIFVLLPVFATVIAYVWISHYSVAYSDDLLFSYHMIQGLVIPLSGIPLIFVYSYIFEKGAKETLIPYYRNVILIDIFRGALFNGLIVSGITWFLLYSVGMEFFTREIFLHLILLFVFFQLVGIALLTVFESVEVVLTILVAVPFTDMVTQGTFLPPPHLFIFMDTLFSPLWLNVTYIFLGVGIIWSVVRLYRTFY